MAPQHITSTERNRRRPGTVALKIILCMTMLLPATVMPQTIDELKITPADGDTDDKFGRVVDMDGDYLVVGAWQEDGAASNAGAAYIFRREGETWVEEAKLVPSDGAADDRFGIAVAIDGNYAAVGAVWDDDNGNNSGSAYVFERDGTTWFEIAKVSAQSGGEFFEFGTAVDISGDYLIVGEKMAQQSGQGSAYIFVRDGANWLPEDQLAADDGETGDHFGYSVGITPDYAVVSSQLPDAGDGAVYIFERDGESWDQAEKLTSETGDEWFGWSVAIDGTRAIVGAHGNDENGTNSGSAYIFQRAGMNWIQTAQLSPEDPMNWGWFGFSVRISTSYAVAGAPGDAAFIADPGAAYLFRIDDGPWVQEAKITASDGEQFDEFGISVSISGDHAVVGAHQDDDNGTSSGSAYVYDGVIPVGIISGSPNGLSFGEVFVGNDKTRELTVTNVGREILIVGPITIENDAANAYTTDTTPFILDPDESNTLEVVFAPTGAGNFISTLSIDSDGGLLEIELTGDGLEEPSDEGIYATDGDMDDNFGRSVAIDGDRVMVGSRADDDAGANAGAAYVYEWDGGTWVETAKLTAEDGAANDQFGQDVACDGDLAIIGARYDDDNATDGGAAYIFTYDGDSWAQIAKLLASVGGDADARFGTSVDISGGYAVVGAPQSDADGEDSGAAYVFEESGGVWNEVALLNTADVNAFDEFGLSVAIDGETILVGAKGDETLSDEAGAAYVFERNGSDWELMDKLTASDGAALDHFGAYVALDGDYAAIGARENDEAGINAGAVYVFERNGSTWTEQAKLMAEDAAEEDWFGRSVGISGQYLVAGAMLDDDGATDAGTAYLFKREGDQWWQSAKVVPGDLADDDVFGWSAAMSGDRFVIGAWNADGMEENSGKAYVYSGIQTVKIDPVADPIIPRDVLLKQNYPNPFNPTTSVEFTCLPAGQAGSAERVRLEIFDIAGRRVTTLVDRQLAAGNYTVQWDGTAASGNQVASGVYLYRLTAGEFTQTRRMLLMR